MKDTAGHKVRCDSCDWKGRDTERLSAPNPFDADDTIYGCPACMSVDCFFYICDEYGCWNRQSCGMPTDDGYRNTCRKHMPREPER